MDLLSGALHLLLLLSAAAGEWQNSTWNVERNPSRSQSEEQMDIPRSVFLQRFPNQELPSAIRPLMPGDRKKATIPLDKMAKAKLAVDNNTGLRKSSVDHSNRLPTNVLPARSSVGEFSDIQKPRDKNIPDSAFASTNLHTAKSTSTQGHSSGKASELLDHENNRPGKINLQKLVELSYNSSKPAWMTNRQPSSLLYQFHGFRKEFESKERSCQLDCHKNRDEREAYCNSDFAVNGIVHDVDTLGKGIQLLTILVNSGGLYKINRLYITPDGFFFKVKVLAVDHFNCPKSCLDFKLGGRYILMGRIFHKRMELPSSIQRTVSGRLRAGDGLLTSSSFVRRYNRKKDRKVLAAAHSKCK